MTLKQLQISIKGKSVKQVVRMFCAEQIGAGTTRDVYAVKGTDKYVIKIERDMSSGMFANATEFRNYVNNMEWTWLSDYLAPCHFINETSQIMVQSRVSWEGKRRKDYPVEIPSLFTDLKLKNFGWIGDKFVCCDYPYLLTVVTKSNSPHPMRKARWWGSIK